MKPLNVSFWSRIRNDKSVHPDDNNKTLVKLLELCILHHN